MKKLICGLSALALLAMPVTAFADDEIPEPGDEPAQNNVITEESDPQSGTAVITTEIEPTYIVTIPTDTHVAFHDTDTDFGMVELTKAQIDPGMAVYVDVDTDGELNNSADDTKIIPYKLFAQFVPGDPEAEGEEGEGDQLYAQFNVNESTLVFDTAGDGYTMDIVIEDEDWNKAYAGSYGDTVIFNVSYDEAPSTEEPDGEEPDEGEPGAGTPGE